MYRYFPSLKSTQNFCPCPYKCHKLVDFRGNLDTCIAIRLAFRKNGRVFVRSGAGIVADSVPENEFNECINKAKAVMNALTIAQEESL